MKSVIITLFISFAGTLSTFAQCEENAVLRTSKTNLADSLITGSVHISGVQLVHKKDRN